MHTAVRKLVRGLRKVSGALATSRPAKPSSSPEAVFQRWRQTLAPLVVEQWFARGGLANQYDSRPGKYDRNVSLLQCLRQVIGRRVEGAVMEFGCCHGHTALLMVETMASLGDQSPLILFDSFEGMPPSDAPEDQHWEPGDLTAPFEAVQARFTHYPNVELVRGFFGDTLPGFRQLKVKFAHVDADMYTSTKDVNKWLLPQLQDGGVVLYDDYGFESCAGAMRAVDEDLAGRPDFFKLYLPTGQYLAIKCGQAGGGA
jgi:O-methyltransferase